MKQKLAVVDSFPVDDSDVGCSKDKPIPVVDFSLSSFSFGVEVDLLGNFTVETVRECLENVFLTMEPQPFINCSRCFKLFSNFAAFQQHFSMAQNFSDMCQNLPMTTRKFFGPSVFFIPEFVLDFLFKLRNSIDRTIFFFDNHWEVTYLPALSPHDLGASERAEKKKEDMKLFVEGKMDLSEVLSNIADRFLAVFQSGKVPHLFHMSPFFAYMPYVWSLWQYTIGCNLSKETNQKLKELAGKIQSSIAHPNISRTPGDSLNITIGGLDGFTYEFLANWTYNEPSQVLIGKFDHDLKDTGSLSSALRLNHLAVITEGLICLDNIPKSGPEFVKSYLPKKSLCLIPFKSSVEGGQLVTMEKKVQGCMLPTRSLSSI